MKTHKPGEKWQIEQRWRKTENILQVRKHFWLFTNCVMSDIFTGPTQCLPVTA